MFCDLLLPLTSKTNELKNLKTYELKNSRTYKLKNL